MSRKRKLTPAQLKFISENQQLSGLSGRITEETANHEVDVDKLAKSAARLGAQIPGESKPSKPRISRWGGARGNAPG